MLLHVNGVEYKITNFQDYEEVFTKYTYLEHHRYALPYLMDALLDQHPMPGEELKMTLDVEKAVTERGKPCPGHVLHFLVKQPEKEGSLLLSYYYMDSINQEIEEDIMEQKHKEMNTKEYDAILNSLLDSLEKHRMLEEKKQVEFCSAYLQKVEADLVSILERLETLQAQIPKEGQLNGIIQEKVSEAVRELNEARDDAKEIKLVFQSSVKNVAMDYKDATALKLRQAVGKLKIPETLGKVKEILNKAEDKMKKSGEWIGVMRGRRQAAAMYRWNAKRVLRGEPALDPVVPENHKGFLANLQTFFWSAEKKLKKAALQCEAAAGKVQAFASEKKIRPEAGRMK